MANLPIFDVECTTFDYYIRNEARIMKKNFLKKNKNTDPRAIIMSNTKGEPCMICNDLSIMTKTIEYYRELGWT